MVSTLDLRGDIYEQLQHVRYTANGVFIEMTTYVVQGILPSHNIIATTRLYPVIKFLENDWRFYSIPVKLFYIVNGKSYGIYKNCTNTAYCTIDDYRINNLSKFINLSFDNETEFNPYFIYDIMALHKNIQMIVCRIKGISTGLDGFDVVFTRNAQRTYHYISSSGYAKISCNDVFNDFTRIQSCNEDFNCVDASNPDIQSQLDFLKPYIRLRTVHIYPIKIRLPSRMTPVMYVVMNDNFLKNINLEIAYVSNELRHSLCNLYGKTVFQLNRIKIRATEYVYFDKNTELPFAFDLMAYYRNIKGIYWTCSKSRYISCEYYKNKHTLEIKLREPVPFGYPSSFKYDMLSNSSF